MMEMGNSALTHMMATQTNILEEIREMRRREDLSNNMGQIASTVSSPNHDYSMSYNAGVVFDPNEHYAPMAQTPMGVYDGNNYYDSPATAGIPQNIGYGVNPTAYGTVASQSVLPIVGEVKGVAKDAFDTAVNFDRTRMSKEETADRIAERSRGFQDKAVDATGKVLGGAGVVGSFLTGGLLSGLAVGAVAAGGTAYIAGSMKQGADTALNYQDILRQDGYKAFNALESTTQYGGIGMNLGDQQDISKHLRDLAPEKFLDDMEMSQILEGALDNKLLKSVKDVEGFKDKFSKIVDSVKEISITLNQSIDEAIEFMGEMERRGVGTQDMTKLSAQNKFAASMTGQDAAQYSNQMMQATDSIIGGTSRNSANVMEGLNMGSYIVTAIEDASREGDGVRRSYIKNNGGALEVAAQMEGQLRNYAEGAGQNMLLGYMATAFDRDEEGNFRLNKETLRDITADGAYDARQLMQMSGEYIRGLSETDKAKLSRSIGQVFNQSADVTDINMFGSKLQDIYQHSAGVQLDPETALYEMGVTNDYMMAGIMSDAMKASTDPNVTAQFYARSAKEAWDSADLADSPSFGSRIKYGWKRNVTNRFGNMGQSVADSVGSISEDIQMTLSGIDERGLMGGELLESYSEENIRDLFAGEDSTLSTLRENLSGLSERVKKEKVVSRMPYDYAADLNMSIAPVPVELSEGSQKVFTHGMLALHNDKITDGELSASDIQRLKTLSASGELDMDSQQRVDYLLNRASGKYEGFGRLNQAADYMKAAYNNGEPDRLPKARRGQLNTLEEIEEIEKSLGGRMETANKEVSKYLAGTDLSGVDSDDYGKLEEAMRIGDMETVRKLTSDSKIIDFTKEYQSIGDDTKTLRSARKDYTDIVRGASGAGVVMDDMFKFIKASGVMDDNEFDRYFKTQRALISSDAKKLDKAIKKGTATDQQLLDMMEGVNEKGTAFFENVSDSMRSDLADFLLESNKSLTMEDLYKDGSDFVLDPEKMFLEYESFSRQQQSGENAAEKSISGEASEKASAAAEEHVVAMENFINAFMNEAGNMQTALTDLRNKNFGKYSTNINS